MTDFQSADQKVSGLTPVSSGTTCVNSQLYPDVSAVNMQSNPDSSNKKFKHLDSKYDLGVLHVSKRVEKIKKARLLDGNKQFFRQNKGNFGYIPLTPLPAKIRDNPTAGDISILEAHKRVKQDGRHNFEGRQIPVQSKLNHENFFNI